MIFVSKVHEFENFELSATMLSHMDHNYVLKEMFFGPLCVQCSPFKCFGWFNRNGPCFSEIL